MIYVSNPSLYAPAFRGEVGADKKQGIFCGGRELWKGVCSSPDTYFAFFYVPGIFLPRLLNRAFYLIFITVFYHIFLIHCFCFIDCTYATFIQWLVFCLLAFNIVVILIVSHFKQDTEEAAQKYPK